MKLAINLVVGCLLLLLGWSVMANPSEHTRWCLTGDATYNIYQQPQRDYCPWVLAGSAVGTWYGNQESGWVMTMTQGDWSRRAAHALACSNNPGDQGKAVGLIAACQCHNGAAAEEVINNPAEVIQVMRAYAGCQ